ncbi:hypothetical protein Esti_002824 [Eimeria stiedai]
MRTPLSRVARGAPPCVRCRDTAEGPLLPAAAAPAAASLGPPRCRRTQLRAFGLWNSLRPWGSKQNPQKPQDEQQQQHQQQPQQQQQQQQTESTESARAAKEAPAAAAARSGKEELTAKVIPSKFAAAFEGPPSREVSGQTSKRSPRKGVFRGPLWGPPQEAWASLSSAAFLQEIQQIFDAAAEARPEPRSPQGVSECRSVRKSLGPLLTRLSRSPLFLHAAAASSAATTAASSAEESAAAPQQQQQQQQQQREQQQQQALFSQALDFAYRSGFTVVCGNPQRLLATGGVRVLHPSRTRGAPDPKPPDLTNEQFCFFAKSFYAQLLKAKLPCAGSPQCRRANPKP